MKKQPMRKRIIWFNFFRLIGITSLVVVLVLIYIYNSSLSVAKQQLINVNNQKLEILSVNMDSTINQIDRIAASLCVDNDSFLFFESKNPDTVDEGIWKRLVSKLKTYSYGIECIDSIILYSNTYDRMISDSLSGNITREALMPIPVDTAKGESEYDTGWVEFLPEVEKNSTFLAIRTVGNGYPHVLTVIKNYQKLGLNATVIINLNLKALYSTVWTSSDDDTEAFVLDRDGKIFLSKGKTNLYEDMSKYSALDQFEYSSEHKSALVEASETSYSYSQDYNEEYGFYFVSATRLSDYRALVAHEQAKIVMIFFVVMIVLGVMILMYCTISFQPFGHIMELLENPSLWKQEQQGKAQYQIQEIVEKIVFYLQSNDDLKTALEQRLELLQTTQLRALKSQLDPHFIYNSLDAVNILVEEVEGEHGRIGQMVQHLVDILRYSLSRRELACLKTELSYLQKYAYIMQCRYGDSIEIIFDFDESLMDAMVPRLAFQPLIENSVFHGIMARNMETAGRVIVRGHAIRYQFEGCNTQESAVRVDVEDNGCGMRPEKLEQLMRDIFDTDDIAADHIGVQNVVKRLRLLFHDRVHVDIQSQYDVGTHIILIFPNVQTEESDEGVFDTQH